jgi:hypothetical protein
MLGGAAAQEVWHVLQERGPFERDRYVSALEALPASPT